MNTLTARLPSIASRDHRSSAARAEPRWLLLGAAMLALCMLVSLVLVLNQAVQRGERLREQQRADGQASFDRAAGTRTRAKDRLLVAASR